MPWVLLCFLTHQAHRGTPLGGFLLCRSVCQALKGAPWVWSYSVVQCIRHLMGQSLLFSSHSWLVGRESMVMAPPPVHDSAVSPCFHGCLAFLHRHFPPQSPPLHPLDLSLCSQQQSSTLGLLYSSQTPALSHCTFQGICVPVQGLYGCGKDYLILIPFRLPQISCFILSLKCSSRDSDNCPDMGIGPLLQFPTC